MPEWIQPNFPERDDPWVEPFDAALIPQLIENMISIIGRDMSAACEAAEAGLQPFKEIYRAIRANGLYPFVAVGGRRFQYSQMGMAGRGSIDATHELIFTIADNDPDPDAATHRVQAYHWALCQMIWAARPNDWTFGMFADDAIVNQIDGQLNDPITPPASSGVQGYVVSADLSVAIQIVEETIPSG